MEEKKTRKWNWDKRIENAQFWKGIVEIIIAIIMIVVFLICVGVIK